MLAVAGLLEFIQDNWCIGIHLPGAVDPHKAFASGCPAIFRYPHRGFIGLQHMVLI